MSSGLPSQTLGRWISPTPNTSGNLVTVTAVGSTTPRELNERFADVVNAKDFGCIGDGVSDDTARLQSAIDSVPEGGAVYLPPGSYRYTSPWIGTAYSGNSGNIKHFHLVGAGAPGMDDIAGANQFGTTLYYAGNAADTPALLLQSTRGCQVHNLAIVADAKAVSGSVGVWIKESNSTPTLDHVSIRGFDEAIRIGELGTDVHNNDDINLFHRLVVTDCNVFIRNASTESFMVAVDNCSIEAGIIYQTESDSAGGTVASLKISKSLLAPSVGVVNHVTGGGAQNTRDIVVIEECVIEPLAAAYLLNMDSTAANNDFGFIFRNNTWNDGDRADFFDSSWRWIQYAGRGPFVFEGNHIRGLTRVPIQLNTVAATVPAVAIRFEDNVWQYKPVFLRPAGEQLPEMYVRGQWYENEPRQSFGDSDQPAAELPTSEPVIAGRKHWRTAPAYGQTWYEGDRFTVGGTSSDPVTVGLVRQRGTVGTLTGVTCSATNGATTVTLTGGSALMKARVQAGKLITINGGSAQEVLDVIGSTVYLANAYAAGTGTGLTVDYYNPVFYQEAWGYSAAPVGSTSYAGVSWNKGDYVHNVSPGDLGAAGSQYTIIGWINIGFTNTWREMRALTGN